VLDTFQDLPVHALIVHATVVMVPTAAITVGLAAVYPRFRAWAGPLPLIAAVISVILTPLSTMSGDKLNHRIKKLGMTEELHEAIEKHEHLAEKLIWFVLVLAVLAAIGYVLHRKGTASKAVVTVVAVLSVLAAVGTAVQVARIGHAGAEATWSGYVQK
jgi:hypothetical protein